MENLTDTTKVKIYTVNPKVWRREKRPKPDKPQNLPTSEDKEFWGKDAQQETITQQQIEANKPDMTHHYLEWDGDTAICRKCPHEHTFPISKSKFDIVDGRPVKKLLDKQKK